MRAALCSLGFSNDRLFRLVRLLPPSVCTENALSLLTQMTHERRETESLLPGYSNGKVFSVRMGSATLHLSICRYAHRDKYNCLAHKGDGGIIKRCARVGKQEAVNRGDEKAGREKPVPMAGAEEARLMFEQVVREYSFIAAVV